MRVLDSMRYSGGDVEFLSYALTCTSRLHYMYSSLTILSTLFLYYFSFLFHHFCFFFFFLIFLSSFISTIFPYPIFFFFFLNDPAPTEIYPLPLHAALPIYPQDRDDVLHLLVALQHRLHAARGIVVLLAHHQRVELAAGGIERIDRRVDASSTRWWWARRDRKSTRLNSSHDQISYAVFCLKK